MKNLLLIASFIIATTTFSQVKVRPGIKAGLNLSNYTNVEGTSSKSGLNAGLFVNVHLARFYELQVETLYSNQGTTFDNYYFDGFDPEISTSSYDINVDYISLGIANKFFPIPNVGFNIIVGPSLDIMINDDDDYTTPIDLSFFGGVGYEFPFGLGLELRYKQGVIDVRDTYTDYYESDNYYDGNNILNSVIQFSASYRFDF